MSLFPLDRIVERLIVVGQLTLIDTDGRRQTFTGKEPGPSSTIRIHDSGFRWKVAGNAALAVGEGYMDGAFTIEEGTLRDFLDVVMIAAYRAGEDSLPGALGRKLNRLLRSGRLNKIGRSQRNVQHHYDIDHRLYELFLDEDMQYSCGYWREGVTSLEQAQYDKKRYIARKLDLRPGMKVLDIGSGWGGMALFLAREYDAEVTGVTLSTDQYETSLRRAREAGLEGRVRFELIDYRQVTGTFDRIVSVGMFEHVGHPHYGEFFDHLVRLLKPDGIALLHTIGRNAVPAPVNPWTLKYIFPGGYLPSLSQLAPELEKRHLWLTDFETLRLHYAKTLREWDRRFQARRAEVAEMFDERFCRMWEFYLQSAERSFHHQGQAVFQLQIARDILAVPLTRNYIYEGDWPAVGSRPEQPALAAASKTPAAAVAETALALSEPGAIAGPDRPPKRSRAGKEAKPATPAKRSAASTGNADPKAAKKPRSRRRISTREAAE